MSSQRLHSATAAARTFGSALPISTSERLIFRFVRTQPASSAARRRFSEDVLGRTIEAVRRYWNQQVFSGRGVPPPQVDSEAAVVEYVLTHPGAIGYVTETTDVRGAKVILVR